MTWPNTRKALKAFLLAETDVTDIVGNRVFYGLPKRGTTFPAITLPGQVGGTQDPGEAPIDLPLEQCDLWGAPGDTDFDDLMALESAVRDAFDRIRSATTVGTAVLYGVEIVGAVDAPDPETDQPRRSLTLAATTRAA